ncbi:MAG: hypothetical protein MI747_24020 [Desulfobacterales bacterium]|nr:hypothetical protein [Desulfobacterales bacterium]
MGIHSCVTPDGDFQVGLHRPAFRVENMREKTQIQSLGELSDGTPVENQINFPPGAVEEPSADPIYEVANAFPFRGTTFINTAWADAKAARPETISIPRPQPCTLLQNMEGLRETWDEENKIHFLRALPPALKLALAQASTDPEELGLLARESAGLVFGDDPSRPTGMGHVHTPEGKVIPDIRDHQTFEILVNNPHLPDVYKEAMVLRPGVQGRSEIVGDYNGDDSHVFEYLRRNSYIPWGHFASNMANDAVRYRASDLSPGDMRGIRHLYYQRLYLRMAAELGIAPPATGRALDKDELEGLRLQILETLAQQSQSPNFTAGLWGWNFGFGAAQSGHRLHASHQMIHQQNALIPAQVPDTQGGTMESFGCGDLIHDFVQDYRNRHGRDFFPAYISAIRNNRRTDRGHAPDNQRPHTLIIYEDDQILLFAPKAQVSEWEIQLMTKAPCAHVLEADTPTRESLDQGIRIAVQILEKLGAQLVTGIELSGRFHRQNTGQHLLYSFIPRLPYAPATFSEAQLRWISGCYPEDFAQACRRALTPP